jgi:hypothetical protein
MITFKKSNKTSPVLQHSAENVALLTESTQCNCGKHIVLGVFDWKLL